MLPGFKLLYPVILRGLGLHRAVQIVQAGIPCIVVASVDLVAIPLNSFYCILVGGPFANGSVSAL